MREPERASDSLFIPKKKQVLMVDWPFVYVGSFILMSSSYFLAISFRVSFEKSWRIVDVSTSDHVISKCRGIRVIGVGLHNSYIKTELTYATFGNRVVQHSFLLLPEAEIKGHPDGGVFSAFSSFVYSAFVCSPCDSWPPFKRSNINLIKFLCLERGEDRYYDKWLKHSPSLTWIILISTQNLKWLQLQHLFKILHLEVYKCSFLLWRNNPHHT